MKNRTATIFLIFIFSIASSYAAWDELDWDYDYVATVLPTDANSISYSDGAKGEFALTGTTFSAYEVIYDATLGQNVLHVSSLGVNSGFYMTENCDPCHIGSITPAFDSEPGYTVQIKIKLNGTDQTVGSACAFQFDEIARNRFWSLNLQSDSDGGNQTVGLNGSITNVVSITPGWHTYRILAKNSGVSLYIDGSTTPTLTASYGTTEINAIRFGDLTGAADSDYELAQLSVYSVRALLSNPTPTPAAWADLKWDYHYDGLRRPQDAASIRYSDSQVGNFGLAGGPASGSNILVYSSELGRNVYYASTLGRDGGFYFSETSDTTGSVPVFSSDDGYTVQLKVKLNSIDETSGGACVFQFDEAERNRYWSLNLQSDPDGSNQRVGLSGTTEQVSISQGWHTYRITANEDGTKLYVDGNTTAALSSTYLKNLNTNQWRFGDFASNSDSDYQIAQLSIYASGAISGIPQDCEQAIEYGFKLAGDIDSDCRVNLSDFALLAGDWLDCIGADSVDCIKWDARATVRSAAQGQSRIIYDNDGMDVVYFTDIATAENLLKIRTTPLLHSQVDTVSYCTHITFSLCLHDTKVGEVFTKTSGTFSNNKVQDFINQGTDPLEIVTNYCRENNIEIFWNMRMNDDHDAATPEFLPQFKQDHPDWLIGSATNLPVNGTWTQVDYTHPEVRNLAFQIIEEVCQNYDIDGVLLDFFRHPVFFKSHADGGNASPAEMDMMTALLTNVRAMANNVGVNRGRHISIAVRVPDSVSFCNAIGLDIENWMQNNLIDILIPTGYFRLSPWETSINLASSYGVKVYAGLSDSRISRYSARTNTNSIEEYRARAMNALSSGANGVYLFNYYNFPMEGYQELGELNTLQSKDKIYYSTYRGGAAILERLYSGGFSFIDRPNYFTPEYPAMIVSYSTKKINIEIDEYLAHYDTKTISLDLLLDDISKAGNLIVKINGHTLSNPTITLDWARYAVNNSYMIQGDNLIEIRMQSGYVTLYDIRIRVLY